MALLYSSASFFNFLCGALDGKCWISLHENDTKFINFLLEISSCSGQSYLIYAKQQWF
jgi:hypothetical protein